MSALLPGHLFCLHPTVPEADKKRSSVYKLGKRGRIAAWEIMIPMEQTNSGSAAELNRFPRSLEICPYLDNWRNNK